MRSGVWVLFMSPQKENGYTPIANELFEAFYRCKLLEYERVIIMCIWRKTYGWSKSEDWVSNSQIEDETGIALPNITRTLNSLKEKRILVKNGKRMSVNKKYKEWVVEWRKVISPDNKVISPDNQKLSHEIPTKTKSNYTKAISKSKDLADDMSWNKQSDDYDLGVVDIDGDLSLKEIKKKPTKKYPNAPTIRKIFQEVTGANPANWKMNKSQLQACENLFTERTPEKVRSALQFYQEQKEDKFCPKITSPYDLDSKWTKLGEYKLSL